MNTQKPVRLTRGWQSWPKGHVFTDMPAAQAQHMVEAGQAEYATEDMAVSPVDRMMRPGNTVRRGGGKRGQANGALI
jgi:hypothetical protein